MKLSQFTIIPFVFLALLCYCTAQSDSSLRAGEVRMGSYGYKCISSCGKKDGTDYFWCNAEHPTTHYPGDTYWDYCSKEEGYDYTGKMCYIEHACGNHGYKYKWCYTNADRSEWGYCGYTVQSNRT